MNRNNKKSNNLYATNILHYQYNTLNQIFIRHKERLIRNWLVLDKSTRKTQITKKVISGKFLNILRKNQIPLLTLSYFLSYDTKKSNHNI